MSSEAAASSTTKRRTTRADGEEPEVIIMDVRYFSAL
jgi:hypothetical protein